MSASEAIAVKNTDADTLAEERISVASNWTLVWWRFKKHRLALFSGVLLIYVYLS